MKKLSEDQLKDKHSETSEILRQRIHDRDIALAAYRREHGILEEFFRQVRDACTPIKPEKKLYEFRKSKLEIPCSVVAHSTDGHHGANQISSEVEGFGTFSPAISERRQLGFMNEFIKWVDLHRHAYTINEMTHIVTGDMISGDIHDELRITNEWPSPVQAVEAGKLLARQVAIAAPHFDKVTVEFITADNHSRLTKKPQAKEAGMNTFNYVVGEVAKAYLRDHNNVVFNLYPLHETVIHVSTRQYLICHGHDVMGWAGLPWYGIERKVGRESVARLQIIMQDNQKAKSIGFHRYVFGHWHTPIDLPLYLGTGSVSGTDAFDHQQGRHSEPSQSGWLVHPRYGEFDIIRFKLKEFD